ncbi:hypothetical protein KIPB_009786, partial [Kipferlia bialata]
VANRMREVALREKREEDERQAKEAAAVQDMELSDSRFDEDVSETPEPTEDESSASEFEASDRKEESVSEAVPWVEESEAPAPSVEEPQDVEPEYDALMPQGGEEAVGGWRMKMQHEIAKCNGWLKAHPASDTNPWGSCPSCQSELTQASTGYFFTGLPHPLSDVHIDTLLHRASQLTSSVLGYDAETMAGNNLQHANIPPAEVEQITRVCRDPKSLSAFEACLRDVYVNGIPCAECDKERADRVQQ